MHKPNDKPCASTRKQPQAKTQRSRAPSECGFFVVLILRKMTYTYVYKTSDGARHEAAEGVVLALPLLRRLLALQLAAGALIYLHLLKRALVEPPPVGARRA